VEFILEVLYEIINSLVLIELIAIISRYTSFRG